MLVNHHLEPLRRRRRHQRQQLLPIEVVRRGHPREALLHEECRSQFIRDVQRKIAGDRQPLLAKESQAADIANEHAVGLGLDHEPEDAHLVGLLDPGRGELDRGSPCMRHLHRLAILPDVGEVGGETPLAEFEHVAQLRERPHQNMQRDHLGFSLAALRFPRSALRFCKEPRPCRQHAAADPPRRQGHDHLLQPGDEVVPEFSEHAVRHHRFTGDVGRERLEFEGSAAQPGKL